MINTVQTCPACRGRGGFNLLRSGQGEGTTAVWWHEWVPCRLCDRWWEIVDGMAVMRLRVKELESTIEELRKPRRRHRKQEQAKETT